MDERKAELKQLKKAYKKEKRRHVTLWKSLGIFFLVFALIFSVAAPVVQIFDNALAAFLGGSFWRVENEDPNANYFELDYKNDEALEKFIKKVNNENISLFSELKLR